MAAGSLQKYFLVVLLGQMALSILNTLFTLGDHNAVIAILGMYGAIRGHKHALLAYMLFSAISTVMDIVRLILWHGYIQSKTLPSYTVLGFYYIMLLSFGMLVKLIGCMFAFFVHRMAGKANLERPDHPRDV